ncbi:hypothetical protein EVAR_23994_1 [Eumeta japonica]|uniref:Uncharacterized protein n=1 Tax=Eumeta variegata TaxID=151549 RepID=A0A4C1WC61_EUMVA|nr:hypothetical protein EVAR_23994_1 [Eumeta japonica]
MAERNERAPTPPPRETAFGSVISPQLSNSTGITMDTRTRSVLTARLINMKDEGICVHAALHVRWPSAGRELLTTVVTGVVTNFETDGLTYSTRRRAKDYGGQPSNLYLTRCFAHLLFAEPAHHGLSSCLLASYALGLICVRASSKAVTATGFAYI